jgi:hypothetical protein
LPGRKYNKSKKTPLRWHHSGSGQQPQLEEEVSSEQEQATFELIGAGGACICASGGP